MAAFLVRHLPQNTNVMTVLISVIIPTRSGAATLERCVDSVISQNVDEAEVLIVDNDSDEATRVVLKSLESRVAQIVRSDRNLGYAGGNDLGSQVAKGEILFLLNDDAWLLPGALEAVLAKMGADPSIGVIGGKVYDPDGGTIQQVQLLVNDQAFTWFLGNGERDDGQYDKEREAEYVTGSAWAIRRDLWERLGGLSEAYFPGYYEDVELCWAARRLGYRVVYLPGVRACHEGMRTVGSLNWKFHYLYHRHRIRFLLRTMERSRIRAFLRAEGRWIISFRNSDQYPALFRAYLWNVLHLRETLRGRKKMWDLLKKEGEFR